MLRIASITSLLIIMSVLAMPGWAQSSQARFRQLDSNHDGLVDQAEYDAGARQSFAALDRDHDGYVSLDELRASIDPNAGGIGADGMARAQLMTMDQNYDNLISEAEFVDFADQSMSKYDRNGDGRLTSDDFAPF